MITAVFNGAVTLEKTIRSVLAQTYKNIEFILIDGGSSDNTLEIIRKYDDSIDYWVSEPDMGIYDAWNKGIALSTGQWIAFLGSDDVYSEDAIEAFIDGIRARTESSIEYISGKALFVVPELGLERVIGSRWNWRTFQKYMNVAHVGSLQHRTLFEKYGIYDTEYKMCGDYELLLRAGNSLKAEFVNKVTVTMHGGGISNRDMKVFYETRKAKVLTGGRGAFISAFEQYTAIARYLVRKAIYQCRHQLARVLW